MRQTSLSTALALAALACAPLPAAAEMGPCAPAVFDLMCGSGDGAARAIVKTISPSKRLAFAWRLADRPPNNRPEENDPNLENFVVRLEDGAVLAKSQGAYWDLGSKIAKAYLMTAWSPDSRLLVKVEQRAEFASAELFAFAADGAAMGPFDLAKVVEPAVLAKTKGAKDGKSLLVFTAHPAMTIDDQGLMHAVVLIRRHDATDCETNDVTVHIARAAGSLDAKVVSVAPHAGASISIIVH